MSDPERKARLDHVMRALQEAGLLAAAVPDLPPVTSLASDSRAVEPGALVLAMSGTQTDGHRFVEAAAENGAVAALVERSVTDRVVQIRVRDTTLAARVAAKAWFGDPSRSLTMTAVTGTNGKTTTTTLARHLLNARSDCGAIGTLGAVNGTGAPVRSTAGVLTTPGPVDLEATLSAMVAAGVTHVVMEASSHSLDQGRLDGLVFSAAVFTNLTREHLDYHRTMEAYLAAKLRLLDLLQPRGVAAVYDDDPAWGAIGPRPGLIRFGTGPTADVRADGVVLDVDACRFKLTGAFGRREVEIPLPGSFNVANALGAAACALGLGVPLDTVVARLASAPQVSGRMERLASRPCLVLRDYAHTPDAMERVLRTLRPLATGRLIVLFGCGGDRDRGKRPLMGRIAGEWADRVILTSDNPRTEDPERILDDIAAGLDGGKVERYPDREEAIEHALAQGREGDVILLAGKGHETYQIVGTTKHPFDERALVAELAGA